MKYDPYGKWMRHCPMQTCKTPIYKVRPWDDWKCLACGWTGK